jgi:hypothetical protein
MSRGGGFRRLPTPSIDLPMPKKTHSGCVESASQVALLSLRQLLELLRRSIAQGRVQPAAIVILLDELLDVGAQIFQVAIDVGMDLFPLQRAHEALAEGVVVGIGRAAHTGYDAVLLQ